MCKLLCSQHRALFLPLSFPEFQERLPTIATSLGYTGRAPASKYVIVQRSLSQPLCLKEKVFMTCPLTVELSRKNITVITLIRLCNSPKFPIAHQVWKQQKMCKKQRLEIFSETDVLCTAIPLNCLWKHRPCLKTHHLRNTSIFQMYYTH